ncbi:hypothetical protein FACS189485_23220 [Spirochaetia bacterium]|nr:hypothetical protein FACS189485_23220 [Spirochaetia bacterium]
MDGFNNDLQTQMEQLKKIIVSNVILKEALETAKNISLKNYYIGAGCIAQTIWNHQMKFELIHGISDIDFVYYDNSDLSFEAEKSIIESINKQFVQYPIKLDIKNQARVHLWYKDHFGYDIKPYNSIENAINAWPTTATSIGVRFENDDLKIYAPFGLNDLFGMIVRANKAQITKEIYLQKVSKWKTKWPTLTIIPW